MRRVNHMTVRDLFKAIPVRKDWGIRDALQDGDCMHCGFPNDRGPYSAFCQWCYELMSSGDDEPLLGLQTAMTVGKVKKELLREEYVDKKVIDVDEENVGFRFQ